LADLILILIQSGYGAQMSSSSVLSARSGWMRDISCLHVPAVYFSPLRPIHEQ